jgi:2-polyprenyl-3-methyl-5-hydroxy-6-metoxy-1,4-benzoquinol methylase
VRAEQIRTEELTAVIREIQERVRSRHSTGLLGMGNIPIPDLMPIVHARDAAEAKVAAIGTVNPREGGLVNSVIQKVKKLVSRALDWHVREQVEFNRAAITCIQATLDALEQQNRAILQLADYFHNQISETRADIGKVLEEARKLHELGGELKDIREHWVQWRTGWEEKLNRSEVYMLRTISELNGSFQHRATLTENHFREAMKDQHSNYGIALEKAGRNIQELLWADLERIRAEYEEIIHAELRIVRQRGAAQAQASTSRPPVEPAQEGAPRIDWLRFADRFRGPEEHVRKAQEMYLAKFAGASDVLDLGCGRGEFLEAAKTRGIVARGVDLNPETVALCHSKGLNAETADLFDYLNSQVDDSIGGLYCSQVIEHLPPSLVPQLVRLGAAKLKRGAWMAFETPNPECLAIFATHFYLDPTHTRPVPPMLMAFYLEEAGLGRIEIVRLSPAVESIPAVGELPEAVRNSLFNGMDYAIFGMKL